MADMYRLKFMGVMLLAVLSVTCGRNRSHQAATDGQAVQKFDVIEVLQTSQYSYLQVLDQSGIRWMAVAKQEIEAGKTYYYDTALEMRDFYSKELDKTFEVIYFVNRISPTPAGATQQPGTMPAHSGKPGTGERGSITLEKTADEMTLARIFENPASLEGEEILIRGIVVKVNEGIMGTNWIHIQDGTIHGDQFDLTVTSQHLPRVGEEVIFKGTLTLNKDFGAGYFYEVIMENAEAMAVIPPGFM